jgi:hypothetical protein
MENVAELKTVLKRNSTRSGQKWLKINPLLKSNNSLVSGSSSDEDDLAKIRV